MKIPSLFFATLIAAAGNLAAQDAIPAQPAAIKHWQDARFGMFIHWGPVSLTGKEIGWSRGTQIPVEEYDNLYKQFNPTKFNADQWVAIAKAAGMKYIVLTTKHHDGFCLWDSKQTDYDIMSTPFKRDVVKELSAACKKAGIGFGTYYSTCDWHNPDFPLTSPGGKIVREKSDLEAYTKYLKAQVTELLTNYGPLFTLWFDVPQKFDAARGQSVINMARAIQPDIVINNRSGAKGDYDTPEQTIGGFQIDRPWESCMTVSKRNQWAWGGSADGVKSFEQCMNMLIRCAGGDGNMMLNVGPMPTGEIAPEQVGLLKEIGRWLTKNGTSIYGTRGGPWKPTPSIVSTRRDNHVYLHILKKAGGPIRVPALPVAIQSAKLLDGSVIKTNTQDGVLSFEIPDGAWDAIDTIVELTIAGKSMDIAPVNATAVNRMKGAAASASTVFGNNPEYGADKAIDGDPETRWATPAGTHACSLELQFDKARSFGGIEIDEAFADPASRVKRFELQKKDGGAWITFHTGTALGAEFHASFPEITTTALRLNILDAGEGPTISEIRLISSSAKP